MSLDEAKAFLWSNTGFNYQGTCQGDALLLSTRKHIDRAIQVELLRQST